jgi:hypothetical protein
LAHSLPCALAEGVKIVESGCGDDGGQSDECSEYRKMHLYSVFNSCKKRAPSRERPWM